MTDKTDSKEREALRSIGEEQAFEAWFKVDCPVEGANAKIAAKAAWKARASLAVSAGSGPLMGKPQEMPDLSALTERGAKAWAGVDAQGLREGFTAADMASAPAQGFRDGVASLAASAGGEPVAHLWQHGETGRTRVLMPDMIVDADASWRLVGPLFLGSPPSPPEGMVGGWISVEDARKPPPGKPVVLWVWAERYQEDDDGRQIAQDASGLHLGEWREAEHGNYFDNYSTPFADREAVLWWMDPAPPTSSADSRKGD